MVDSRWVAALPDFDKKGQREEEVFKVEVGLARFRNAFHHVFNPLHVYCRLKDMGVPSPMAQKMCRAYERFVFRLIP